MKVRSISIVLLMSHLLVLLVTTLMLGSIWLYSHYTQSQRDIQQLQEISKNASLSGNITITHWINYKAKENTLQLWRNVIRILLIFVGIGLIVVFVIRTLYDRLHVDLQQMHDWLQKPTEKLESDKIYFDECVQLAGAMMKMAGGWIAYPKQQQTEYHLFLNNMTDGFAFHQLIQHPETKKYDYRFLMINPAFERLTGLTSQRLVGKTVLEMIPNTEQSWIETYQNVALTGSSVHFDRFHQEINRHFRVYAYCPMPGYFACIFHDITDLKEAETKLRANEMQYRQIVEAPTAHICRWYPDSTLTYANKAYADAYGKQPEDLLGTKWIDLVPPEFKQEMIHRVQDLSQNPRILNYEWQVRDHARNLRWMLWTDSPIFDHRGNLVEFESIGQDITDRKHAESMLEIKNQIAQIFLLGNDNQIYQQILDVIMARLSSPHGMFGYINEQGDLEVPSFTPGIWDKYDEKTTTFVFPRHRWLTWWTDALIQKKIMFSNVPLTVPNGHFPMQRAISIPIQQQDNVIGLLMVANKEKDYTTEDVLILEGIANSIAPILSARLERNRQETKRHQIEERLDKVQSLLRAAMLESPVGILVAEAPSGKIRFVNDTAYSIRGRSKVSLTDIGIEEHVRNWQIYKTDGKSPYPPDKSPLVLAIREGISTENSELIIRHEDKKNRWISVNAAPIRNKDGQIIAGIMLLSDITKHKEIELEQQKLQDQLQQAQKMECMGRLAAGVAHDFNNILSVIIGYITLLEDSKLNEIVRREHLQQIAKATDDGKRLTGQLLAFSRQQTLNMQVVNLNQIIHDLKKMLARLIGAAIKIKYELDPNIGLSKIDGIKLDQILMNLTINASDAMPHGGELTIQTSSVEMPDRTNPNALPQRYVALTVSDTGYGMPPEVLQHVFEPFFTTKPKGNGLGLATVYGIVKQHEGEISVQSTVNVGTTFKILFPAIQEQEATEAPTSEKKSQELVKLHGVILVVEDEEGILEMTSTLLSYYGFQVFKADNARDALRIALANKDKLQLLFTDLVMPEIDGPSLAHKIQTICPHIKVLYTSGYPDEFLDQRNIKIDQEYFLQKPAPIEVLIDKISAMLGQPVETNPTMEKKE